jgi:hypothetical protein
LGWGGEGREEGQTTYLDKVGEFGIAIGDQAVHFGLCLGLLLCAQRDVPLAQSRLALTILQQQKSNLEQTKISHTTQ